MPVVFLGLTLAMLIIIANIIAAGESQGQKQLFHGLLLALNLPLIFLALLFLVLPDSIMAELAEAGGLAFNSFRGIGLALLGTAVAGLLVTLGPVRRLLARFMPLNPDSPVHTLALFLAVYLTGNTAITLSQSDLAELASTSDATPVSLIILQGLLFSLVAVLGVGAFVRRRGRVLLERLGLQRLEPRQLLIGVGWIMVLVILQGLAGALWAWFNPDEAQALEDLSSSLLADVDTILEWLLLALAAGISEELLFRGALQPVLGIWATSGLFAVAHIQYGLTPITFFIFFLAIVLGYIRRNHNTSLAIFVHAGYNFVLGLLALLAVWLEQFVT